MDEKKPGIIKSTIKYGIRILVGFFVLLAVLYLVVIQPQVQNYIVNHMTSSLSRQIGTKVSIGSVRVHFFDSAELNDLLIEDLAGDSLLYNKFLQIDIGFLSIFQKDMVIDNILSKGLSIKTTHDIQEGTSNYDFLFSKNNIQKTEKAKNKNEWKFHIKKIHLMDYNLRQNDNEPNNNVRIYGDEIIINPNKIDLNEEKIDIKSISLRHNHIKISSSLSSIEQKQLPQASSQSTLQIFPQLSWEIRIDKIEGEENSFIFNSENKPYAGSRINFNNLNIKHLNTDIYNLQVNQEVIQAEIALISLEEQSGLNLTGLSGDFHMKSNEMSFDNFIIKTPNSEIKNHTKIEFPNELDTDGLLTALGINASFLSSSIAFSDLDLFAPEITKYFNWNINEPILFQGEVNGSPDNINIDKLKIEIGKYLDLSGDVHIAGLKSSAESQLSFNLKKGKSSYAHLQSLFRNIEIPGELEPIGEFNILTKLEGNIKSLFLKDIDINSSSGARMRANGQFANINDIDKLTYELNIKDLQAPVGLLKSYITIDDFTLFDSITMLKYEGSLVGDLHKIRTNGELYSELGAIGTNVQINFTEDYSDGSFIGNLKFVDFEIGRLLSRSELGPVTLDINIDGSGWTPQTLNANIDAHITKLQLGQQDYHNITLNVLTQNQRYQGKLSIDQPAIRSDVEGYVDLSNTQPEIFLSAHVDTIRMSELNLTRHPINLSFEGSAHVYGTDINKLLGTINVDDLHLSDDTISFYNKNIQLVSTHDLDSAHVTEITSDFLYAHLSGYNNFTEIPKIILKEIYNIIPSAWDISFPFGDNSLDTTTLNEPLDISLVLNDFTPLGILGLGDAYIHNASMDIKIDTTVIPLKLNISIDTLSYEGISSADIKIMGSKNAGIVEAQINASNTSYNTFILPEIKLQGRIKDNDLIYNLDIFSDTSYHFLKFAGTINKINQSFNYYLNQDFVINNEQWTIPQDYVLSNTKGNFYINNLSAHSDDKRISLNSVDTTHNYEDIKPLNIEFNNFPVAYFINAIDDINLHGAINGNFLVKGNFDQPSFNTKLEISNLTADSILIGDLNITAQDQKSTNIQENGVTINVALNSPVNIANATGFLREEDGYLNVHADIEQFSMKQLDPLLKNVLSNSKGLIKGSLDLQGIYNHPALSGKLNLIQVESTVELTKTRYSINEHEITLKPNEIEFDGLVVLDKNQNNATISGRILHSNFSDFILDATIETSEFEFLNTTVKDNPLFYGNLYLQTTGTIKGPIDYPAVNINAKALANTILHLSPFADVDVSQTNDFVIFSTPEEFKNLDNKLSKTTSAFPLLLNLNLELSDKAELQFIIDDVSQDKLICRGTSNLTLSLNPTGSVDVYGNYTVSSGSYDFSYSEFLKKQFKIVRGSTVVFNGDPLNATLNATATYTTETSTYDLIKNETNLSQIDLANAKRKSSVNVLLSLKGQLNSPNIEFDIKIPNSGSLEEIHNQKLISLRSNPSEMNNQVFGLLLLNRFLLSDGTSNNTATSISRTGSSQALSSVSKLFTDQLNKMADKYIKGVEVNFDINSYQKDDLQGPSSSIVTELGVGISKSLLNERLRVQASGNLDLENVEQYDSFTSLAGDFLIEYKLNEQGNYILRVYRRSNYDHLIDQQTSKNGIGIFFKKSFDDRNN